MPNVNTAAQIVPGREDNGDIYKTNADSLAEARIYGSDLNLASIKSEPTDIKVPCFHSTQLSQLVSMSINVDKARTSLEADQFFEPDFSAEYLEDVKWGKRLISETKNLFQFPTINTRDFMNENYRSYLTVPPDVAESHIVPESMQSWFEQPFTDIFANRFENDDINLQADSYLSETSSDSESLAIKKDVESFEERLTEQAPPNPWMGSLTTPRTNFKKPATADAKKQFKRCKTSFKSGRPRLCQFLLELLDNPDKFSNLIEWLDKEKGIFKFLNSSSVAQEWGARRNKPKMKYENFARSLRTYIAKGILTKPRSKLVYRFTSISF
ncbi:hypothetical protein QZH41_000717 [Actinostola sp. cb2023]|nr:hypothetical protein QZH41_000717 [Actinostola sp. cb2023]